VDGRLDTSWSTSAAQGPGHWFAVHFGEPREVASVHLWLGGWPDQFPLACVVEVADGSGQAFRRCKQSVSFADVYRSCLLDHRHARLIIDVEPTRCRAIRLSAHVPEQVSYARAWSIAELAVFPKR